MTAIATTRIARSLADLGDGGVLDEILSGGETPLSGSAIPPGKRAYFQERLKGRAYDLVINEFLRQRERDPSLTQADVARRLGKRPEQINRWFSGPGNWTLETLSDLLLAICGGEPSIGVSELRGTPALLAKRVGGCNMLTMPAGRSANYEEGWRARFRDDPFESARMPDWRNGWYDADCALKVAGRYPTVAEWEAVNPGQTPSLSEDRRLTALNIAAKWADHGCNRVDLENATLRIERYLRTGSFEGERPEAPPSKEPRDFRRPTHSPDWAGA